MTGQTHAELKAWEARQKAADAAAADEASAT